jgi:hypothetical protein
MSEKKVAPANKKETGAVNYINTRAESSPFSLKIGDEIIKPVIQANNSFIWPIPRELLTQAQRHTHLITGRLIAEK